MARNLCFYLLLSTLSDVALGNCDVMDQNDKKLGISLKNYCESWRINVELHNIREFDVVPQECVEHIGKYMTSTQYKVDLERAFTESTLYLNTFSVKGDGKDAWIFDIDDTLLSTVPYFKSYNFGGEKLNKSCLEAWMKACKAPAVPHAVEFFTAIKHRGLKIFLISSRAEHLREATIDNLVKVGFYGWSGLVLRGFGDDGKNVQTYKADQRKQLRDSGYRIWGSVGDHWSSLEGLPTAKRTFKLPNSLYSSEGAYQQQSYQPFGGCSQGLGFESHLHQGTVLGFGGCASSRA